MKLSGLLGYQTTKAYETTTKLGKTYHNETSDQTLPVQLCYVEITPEAPDNYQNFID